ncbi:MAG: mechanosensitive ion channel family protein, partial [Muribaculaceae bacterium]|nr:mechanosensitive ion channel family protein [Muribaculaceae bacterium]
MFTLLSAEPPVAQTSHTVATWLLNLIDSLLGHLGLGRFQTGEEVIYLSIVIVAAFAIGWVIQNAVAYAVRKLVKMHDNDIARELLEWHTIRKCCRIIPPLLFLALAPFAFDRGQHIVRIIERLAWIYVLVAFAIGLCAVVTFAFNHYNIHRNTKKLPIQGVLNLSKGIIWIITAICAVGVILDKSPAALLTGLGAFSAALMLIFKDSILGFVAGIQMTQND